MPYPVARLVLFRYPRTVHWCVVQVKLVCWPTAWSCVYYCDMNCPVDRMHVEPIIMRCCTVLSTVVLLTLELIIHGSWQRSGRVREWVFDCQGDQLSGKPGNVWKFYRCPGSITEKCLLLTSWLGLVGLRVFSRMLQALIWLLRRSLWTFL